MLHGDTGGFVSGVEATGRAAGSDNDKRSVAVAAVEGLHQVALFHLGGQTRGGTATLHVDDHQRKLGHHGETHGFALQRETRAGGRRHGEAACVGSADRRHDAGDFVFSLVGLDVEVLVFGQFGQYVGGRRDGIGTEEDRAARLLGSGHQTPSSGGVTGDVAVLALLKVGSLHTIGVREKLPSVSVVVTGVEDGAVGLDHLVLAFELGLEISINGVEFAVKQVHHDTEGKHVLRFQHRLVVHAEVLQGLLGEFRDGGLNDLIVGEGAVDGRVVIVTSLLESFLRHRVGVEDNDGAGTEPTHVCLDGGGVHGHEDVAEVACGVYRFVSEVHLEARDASHGALRWADFSRIVREGGEIVSGKCC